MNFIKSMMLVTQFVYIVRSENCMPLTSKTIYGNQTRWRNDDEKCFEVPISSLKEITVHKLINVVGFTFNFTNGDSKSYIENTNYKNSTKIDLRNAGITGYDIYTGDGGVETIKFQLSDSSSTGLIGDMTNGCFSYLNSSVFKIQFLEINRIYGCVDNNSNCFPYLAFSFDFSNCPLRQVTSIIATTGNSTTSSSSTTELTTHGTTSSSTLTTNPFNSIAELNIRLLNGILMSIIKHLLFL